MRAAVVMLITLMAAVTAQRDEALPQPLRGVGFDQRLNELVPLDLAFRDETGRSVRLGDYFHGKPVILVLAYYRCPMLCNLVLNGLVDSVNRLAFRIGDEFEIVTVSFDPRETPDLAAAKKQAIVGNYNRVGAESGWHFLVGDAASIDRLTESVGFRYAYDAKQAQYAHASGISVLTPQGRIARYFFGVEFSPRDLRLALVEASANRIGSPIDQAMLFCYQYDAATGKYTAAVLQLVRLGAVLTMSILAAYLWWLSRRTPRTRDLNRATILPNA